MEEEIRLDSFVNMVEQQCIACRADRQQLFYLMRRFAYL